MYPCSGRIDNLFVCLLCMNIRLYVANLNAKRLAEQFSTDFFIAINPSREAGQKTTDVVFYVCEIGIGLIALIPGFLSVIVAIYNTIRQREKSFTKNLMKLNHKKTKIDIKSIKDKVAKSIKGKAAKIIDLNASICKYFKFVKKIVHWDKTTMKPSACFKNFKTITSLPTKDLDMEEDLRYLFTNSDKKRQIKERIMDYGAPNYELKCKYDSLCYADDYRNESIRCPHDSPQNNQSSDSAIDIIYTNDDTSSIFSSDFSSSSDGTSHDELSQRNIPDLNRLIMLQSLSYRPSHRFGFHGPTYVTESESSYDAICWSKSSTLSSLYDSDSYSSIDLSLNSDRKCYKPRLCRDRNYNMSVTTFESSHLMLGFTDYSGSEL